MSYVCHPHLHVHGNVISLKSIRKPLVWDQAKAYPACSCHIFAWEPATAKERSRRFSWEPATAKKSRISSLQLSHFHLGACHRKKKKVKKFQFATVTLIWAPATRKREQMCSLQVSHSHLGACHRLNVKNIQFAAVTFSPGGLPPPKKK